MKNKQPDSWRNFGQWYVGCPIGNYTVTTIVAGMDAAAEVIEMLDSEDRAEINEMLAENTWH